MNIAQKYFDEKLKDDEFRKAYSEEKLRLDIEFMVDELKDKIKADKSKLSLIREVNKIKRVLAHA
jgi:hypothetical protein